jgi:flagella basal body P-ring formation protein FlgA
MEPGNKLHWLFGTVLLFGGLLAGTQAQAAADWQDHAAIRAAAEAAARNAVPGGGAVVADNPDPRLRLARCELPLAATVPALGVRSARFTAEVRCDGARPWRLYLPVRVTSVRPVVVAARALPRDTLLAPGDVRLAFAEPATIPAGALHDTGLVVGRVLRRPADEGQALTTGFLVAPTLVRRGQQVSVEARSGALAVRMEGVARGDGALGDLIEVENVNSGRVVQAVVRSAKSVEVLLR